MIRSRLIIHRPATPATIKGGRIAGIVDYQAMNASALFQNKLMASFLVIANVDILRMIIDTPSPLLALKCPYEADGTFHVSLYSGSCPLSPVPSISSGYSPSTPALKYAKYSPIRSPTTNE